MTSHKLFFSAFLVNVVVSGASAQAPVEPTSVPPAQTATPGDDNDSTTAQSTGTANAELLVESEEAPASESSVSGSSVDASDVVDPEPSEPEHEETQLVWGGGIDLFARYRGDFYRDAEPGAGGQRSYHQFELERGHLWFGGQYGIAEANILIEAVPGSDEGGALALAGDSTLLRMREGYAAVRLAPFRIAAGMVRSFTQPFLETIEGMRPVGMGAQEAMYLLAPADLGATLTWRPSCNRLAAGLGIYSGESYRSRELNSEKNVEIFLRARPLSGLGFAGPVIAASFLYGSEGVASTKAHRAFGMIGWDKDNFAAGVAYTHAFGYRGDGLRQAWLLQAFARATIANRWIALIRGSYMNRNTSLDANRIGTLQFGGGAHIHPALSTFLTATYRDATDSAAADDPTWRAWEILWTVRGRFERNSIGLDELR